jgi:uncharacterized OsmC-like protein
MPITPLGPLEREAEGSSNKAIVTTLERTAFGQAIFVGDHTLHADQPLAAGGQNVGPDPYQYLLAALGACTSMIVEVFARRKSWPLEQVVVRLTLSQTHPSGTDGQPSGTIANRIERSVDLVGPLSDAQRDLLLKVADMCPLVGMLSSGIDIVTTLTAHAAGETLDLVDRDSDQSFPASDPPGWIRMGGAGSPLHIDALTRLVEQADKSLASSG